MAECPKCGHVYKDEGRKKGGEKSKRTDMKGATAPGQIAAKEGKRRKKMIEALLKDYIIDTKKSTYPDFKLREITTTGDIVMFREVGVNECSIYSESHQIPLLDILAWAYNKAEESKKDKP
jgi:hypothetical protein